MVCSAPAVIPVGWLEGITGDSVTTPSVVIFAIFAASKFREDQVVPMSRINFLSAGRNGIEGKVTIWRELADLLHKPLSEPGIPVRAGGDRKR
jgi:hypothetical protein